MRSYLFVFWALVILGIILLTAAYPEFRQYQPASQAYCIYDADGARTFVSGGIRQTGTLCAAGFAANSF